ncbi:hypothetical protein ACFFJI_11450 [Allobacillus sp. GCM10007491]|uniref:Uncharacterized protein n=1 Tax=Allobacillus saliphilus TaxID=2912308 RepID=A0A941HSD7_9BACI|nr:hypothetical protein [Allobacillus saliphilus]MBR7553601.1 hypothetical protein [Allobacillus saliphilus]
MKLKKVLLDILGYISFSAPYPDVDTNDISNNLKVLKRTQWFQALMKDEKHRELIVHNKDVRYEIGYLNTERLKRNAHKDRYKNKIQKILEKEKKKFSEGTIK